MSEPSARAQFKNVDPPFWVAWNQALASIRVRFFRQLITSVGIALGIAFYASMQTLRIAESSLTKDDTKMQWLVATSLLMCLVGVTNSMLMSVSERFREIGTIKCLGASDSFIVRVFFWRPRFSVRPAPSLAPRSVLGLAGLRHAPAGRTSPSPIVSASPWVPPLSEW